MPKKKVRKGQHRVRCADAEFWFVFDEVVTAKELQRRFNKQISFWQADLFPGLVLEDHAGKRWKPKLIIELEECNG